jgi:hypothetical protein
VPADDEGHRPQPPPGPAAVGDRVERTGLALVHEGEYIMPAAGSEALLSPAPGSGQVVNYYFPVEIELVGDLDATIVKQIVEKVFSEFDRELASRQ